MSSSAAAAAAAAPESDSKIQEAALHIAQCDFLLIATGAGFSADSGLPTYNDVAQNPIYQRQGMDYGDLCRISCLTSKPALFYGFWGSCFNAYQTAKPHAGYQILKQWLSTKDYYIYTSNVDGHFRHEGFLAHRMDEMHGAIDTWLRVRPDDGTILEDEPPVVLDQSFSFPVSDELEISPKDVADLFVDRYNNTSKEANNQNDTANTRSSSAPLLFRPAVLLFDDGWSVHEAMGLSKSSDQYQAWEEEMEAKMELDSSLKLVVLEIGCGIKVPSVRNECEDVIEDTCQRCLQSTISPEEALHQKNRFVHIRINPDDFEIKNPVSLTTAISIQGTALETLQAIDGHVTKLNTRK